MESVDEGLRGSKPSPRHQQQHRVASPTAGGGDPRLISRHAVPDVSARIERLSHSSLLVRANNPSSGSGLDTVFRQPESTAISASTMSASTIAASAGTTVTLSGGSNRANIGTLGDQIEKVSGYLN